MNINNLVEEIVEMNENQKALSEDRSIYEILEEEIGYRI